MSETAPHGEALYQRDGDVFVPSALTQGPWDPGAQHGGALAALAARCIEALPRPVPMRLCRLSLDLLRAVPLAPLEARTSLLRQGKRLQLVETRLCHEGAPRVRATGLFIRSQAVGGLAAYETPAPIAATTPEQGQPPDPERELPGYLHALDFRSEGLRLRGAWSASIWCRLRVPVVAGESPSPLVRLAAAADFASGLANPVDHERYVSINPDLCIRIEREPISDWVGVEGETRVSGDGMGHSLGSVFDLRGRVARVEASLYIDERQQEQGKE